MAELTSIVGDKTYMVRGDELINLTHRIDNALADISWQRTFVHDALNVISDNECSFPKFVARIGILLGHMDEAIASIKNTKLKQLAAGMHVEELLPSDIQAD